MLCSNGVLNESRTLHGGSAGIVTPNESANEPVRSEIEKGSERQPRTLRELKDDGVVSDHPTGEVRL